MSDVNREGTGEMPPAVNDHATDIVQVSARVTKGMRQRLKMAAVAEDTTVQAILEHAMEEYLRKRDL